MTPANHNTLVSEIADQADELLAGCTSRYDANVIILEYLTARHRVLSIADRRAIAGKVIALLDNEGFFDSTGAGDSWDSDTDDDQGEE